MYQRLAFALNDDPRLSALFARASDESSLLLVVVVTIQKNFSPDLSSLVGAFLLLRDHGYVGPYPSPGVRKRFPDESV